MVFFFWAVSASPSHAPAKLKRIIGAMVLPHHSIFYWQNRTTLTLIFLSTLPKLLVMYDSLLTLFIADEMDKKLLLAMQYQCNFAGLAVPWTEIGGIMGDGITGGAVIQHLAKLRIRMVAQGLSVPPPLRRGGGGPRISTSSSSGSKAKATPPNNGSAQAKSTPTKPTSTKPKKAGKKATQDSDESEDEEDSWNNDESDAEYGKPRVKRAKTEIKGPMRRKMKTEGSEEEPATPSKPPKRKHQSSKSSSRDLSAYGTTDINGKPIDDDDDDGDDSDVEDDNKAELVATGAPWLALEDDYTGHSRTGKKTPYKKQSLVVSLPTTPHKTGMVGTIKEEDTGDMSDDESEDEVVGGEVENCVDVSHVLSNEEMDQEFSSSPYNQNFDDLAAAQIQPVSGSTIHNGVYSNSYHARPQVMPLNGDLYQDRQTLVNAFNNDYSSPSVFQASDSIFENDGFVQNQAMVQSSGFDNNNGGNFDVGRISTNFNDQSAGDFEDINGVINLDFNSNGGTNTDCFGNSGISNGLVHQEDFSYQTDNGYGVSFNAFGNNAGGLPLLSGHSHVQSVPYPIQTSWPSSHGSGASNETSVNQTPAGTSAGADANVGYFGNGGYGFESFDSANIDYSANDNSDMLFNPDSFDGNFVGGGLYGSNSYRN